MVCRGEWAKTFPNSDLTVLATFSSLLTVAQVYHAQMGRHLSVYGDIGELLASLTIGLKLHRNYAKGADGRAGNDHVEVKTLAPSNTSGLVTVKSKGHFNKLFVAKISPDFALSARIYKRSDLGNSAAAQFRVRWV